MSLEPFEHVADALLSHRFYCPRPSELNDPLEGTLGMTAGVDGAGCSESHFEHSFRFWSGVDAALNRFRVCCFSAAPDSPLMWAHYGRGHAGICVELDMADHTDELVKVEYVHDTQAPPHTDPRALLSRKSHHWAYEREYRIIGFAADDSNRWLDVDIRAVLIGTSMRAEHMRPLFEVLRLTKTSAALASFGTTGDFQRFPVRNDLFAKPSSSAAPLIGESPSADHVE